MKVYHYGFPRSGSTYIWQILKTFFDVQFSHDFMKVKDDPLVITYRDFRDITISHWRIWHGQFDEKKNLINSPNLIELNGMVRSTKINLKILNIYKKKYRDKKNVLWLKYEDFYKNYDYIFDQLKSFFKIEISKEKTQEIIKKTNIETNKKIADNIKIKIKERIFDNYDGDTHIHANHISPIEPAHGYWKKIVPEMFWDVVEMTLDKDLKEWGYK